MERHRSVCPSATVTVRTGINAPSEMGSLLFGVHHWASKIVRLVCLDPIMSLADRKSSVADGCAYLSPTVHAANSRLSRNLADPRGSFRRLSQATSLLLQPGAPLDAALILLCAAAHEVEGIIWQLTKPKGIMHRLVGPLMPIPIGDRTSATLGCEGPSRLYKTHR